MVKKFLAIKINTTLLHHSFIFKVKLVRRLSLIKIFQANIEFLEKNKDKVYTIVT
jgi:hypothetical protein